MSDFYTRDRRETSDGVEFQNTYWVHCDDCDFDDDLEIKGTAVWTNGSIDLYSDWSCPWCGHKHDCQYVTTVSTWDWEDN